jgi:hypothetical protein
MIVLRSDIVGEDCPYTMGAVLVPDNVSTDKFQSIVTNIINNNFNRETNYIEYSDDDIFYILKKRFGFEYVTPPEEITIK